MKQIKIFMTALATLAASVMITGCSSDDEPSVSPENYERNAKATDVTPNSLDGVWVAPANGTNPLEVCDILNQFGRPVKSYSYNRDYLIFGEGFVVQYFKGYYLWSFYNITDLQLTYGGLQVIRRDVAYANFNDVPMGNIEIIKATYKPRWDLLTRMTIIEPKYSRREVEFTNTYPDVVPRICRLIVNDTGSYLFEAWEEDARGNVVNYTNLGVLGRNFDTNGDGLFACFADKVYVRALEYDYLTSAYKPVQTDVYELADKPESAHLVWVKN